MQFRVSLRMGAERMAQWVTADDALEAIDKVRVGVWKSATVTWVSQ